MREETRTGFRAGGVMAGGFSSHDDLFSQQTEKMYVTDVWIRGTQREYSSKPLKHSIVKRILVFKR